jgi:hypothetical protein
MPAHSVPDYGATPLIFAAGALLLVAAVCFGVKLRAAARRGFGVQVYDIGADLTLPRALHSRSYQIAFYLTMKSLPREASPAPSAQKLTAPAATSR